MSYISLYRKWRPQNFDEIVGQRAVIQTLKNAIKNNRLSHAYLFCGPRGTGKTSAARILAKALNCEKGPTPGPCGSCPRCTKIRDGHAVDVIEIDAASNRGIDEIRDLREQVRFMPVEGRYKVYIIDEVHMLTTEAFNALLKTLEEPPAQVIFVLATTDSQKVPLTISSRCQRLDFGRLKLVETKEQLGKIAQAEGYTVEEKALDLIGRNSEGALRDAISLLDQLVSFAGEKVSYDNVVLLLGTADEEMLFSFADALNAGDIPRLLELIRKGMEEGRSILQVARDLVSHFRNLLHLKVGSGEALELTADYLERLKKQAENFSLEAIKSVIRALSRAELDMKWHPHGRLVLEVALLELLEKNVGTGFIPVREERTATRAVPTPVPKPVNDTGGVTDQRIIKIKDHWKDILETVRNKSPFSYVSLHEGEPVEINGKGKLVIGFRKGYSFHKERLEDKKNREVVEESIRELVGEAVPIECLITDRVSRESASVTSAESVADFFGGKVLS